MIIKAKGLTLNIEPDEYPPNPREQGSLDTMLCWHRQYDLGDKNPYAALEDFDADKELQDSIFAQQSVYMLDHSGLAFSASPAQFRAIDPQGYDWGTVGVIYITKDNAIKIYGDLSEQSKQKAEQGLVDEIEEYDRFHNTQYYSYSVEDGEGSNLIIAAVITVAI